MFVDRISYVVPIHSELEIGFSEKTFFIRKVDFSALKIKFGLYSNKAIKNRLINLGIIQVGLRILKLTVLFRSVNIFGIVQRSRLKMKIESEG